MDRMVPCTAAAASTYHLYASGGVTGVLSAFFVPGDLDIWPLTLTFKFVQVRDQTCLPHEFGANLFSSFPEYLRHKQKKQNAKNRNLKAYDDISPLLTIHQIFFFLFCYISVLYNFRVFSLCLFVAQWIFTSRHCTTIAIKTMQDKMQDKRMSDQAEAAAE